jgi:hypothetical protein
LDGKHSARHGDKRWPLSFPSSSVN